MNKLAIDRMSLEELELERDRLRGVMGGPCVPEFAFISCSEQLEYVLLRIKLLKPDEDGLYESTTKL